MLSTIFFYENHYGGWIELVAPLVEYYQGELVVVYGDPRMESYNMLRLMSACFLKHSVRLFSFLRLASEIWRNILLIYRIWKITGLFVQLCTRCDSIDVRIHGNIHYH